MEPLVYGLHQLLSRHDAPALKRPVTNSFSLETTCTPIHSWSRVLLPALFHSLLATYQPRCSCIGKSHRHSHSSLYSITE